MADPLSDEEVAQLRKDAEEAKRLRSEHEAEKKARAEAEAKHAAAVAKYDSDMKQVAAYLQQQNQPRQPEPTKEEDDPDAIVSRKDLRRASEETARRAAETSAQHAQLLLRNQRSINKQLATQRLGPKAEKYMAEIDAHLDRLDPAVAAQPTAYDEVFKYVRSAHIDEELEEARQAREAEGNDDEPMVRSPESSPRAIPRTESVAPGSSTSAPRAIARSQAQKPRLTEEQRRVAAGFGMSDEDYAGQYATDDVLVQNDPWGFRGRKRV